MLIFLTVVYKPEKALCYGKYRRKWSELREKCIWKEKKRNGVFGVQKQAKREAETTEIVNPTLSRSRDCSE